MSSLFLYISVCVVGVCFALRLFDLRFELVQRLVSVPTGLTNLFRLFIGGWPFSRLAGFLDVSSCAAAAGITWQKADLWRRVEVQ